MADWQTSGIEDDMRLRMFELSRERQAFALATIAAADGGPRPVGSQMVITQSASWGFLSGGCIEDDVARNARSVLAENRPRQLVYGRGSPFIDIRLPCGGRLEVLIERIAAGDRAVRHLQKLTELRSAAIWASNGRDRDCVALGNDPALRQPIVRFRYLPTQRLLVVGTDPIALTLAGLGAAMGWDTTLLAPFGPAAAAPFGVACDRRPLAQSLRSADLDRWTAVAVATHDLEADEQALVTALASDASYVGVLGSRRKLAEREARLTEAGLTASQIRGLHAPIGLAIGAASPWEIAVSVVAQVIQERGDKASMRLSSGQASSRVAA